MATTFIERGAACSEQRLLQGRRCLLERPLASPSAPLCFRGLSAEYSGRNRSHRRGQGHGLGLDSCHLSSVGCFQGGTLPYPVKTLQSGEVSRRPAVRAAKQSSFVSWTSTTSQDLKVLEEWLQKAALPAQKVVIEEVGEGQGRGLVAAQRINRGDTVVKVPKSLLITAEKVYSDPTIGALLKDNNVPDWPALAVFLLYERSKGLASDWAPYIAALPRQTGCVLEWPEGQVDSFLQGSPLHTKARLCVREVEDSFAGLHEVLFTKHPGTFPPKVFTLNKFKWAFSILFSRLVRLPAMGNAVALVPFADMANHSVDATTFFDYDTQSGAVILKADKSYEKGQQVFDSYGPRSSGDLLLSYGFVPKLDSNPHEYLDLPFETSPQSSSQIDPPESCPVRLAGMPEQLWEAARRRALEVPQGEQELVARQLLLEAVQKVLRGYKRTMEEDEALAKAQTTEDSLNAVSLTQREIGAATVRVIDRRILYRTEAVLRGEIRVLKQQGRGSSSNGDDRVGSKEESRTILSRVTSLFRR